MPTEAANLVLAKSGFELKPEATGGVSVIDDGEVVEIHSSVEDAVNSLAQQDLIQGTDQQKILSAIGAEQTSGAAGTQPGPGAQLIAKPQSYYKESEYFAPQQTGGQRQLQGRRADREEVFREAQQPDQVSYPSSSDSAGDQLRFAKEAVDQSRPARTQQREVGQELAQELRSYAQDDVSAAFNAAFFPKQHEQLQEIKRLAIEATDARREAQQMINRGELEAPGAELDAPKRRQVDDLFRQSTQALEEMRRRIERADVPGKAPSQKGTMALGNIQNRLGLQQPEVRDVLRDIRGEDGEGFGKGLKLENAWRQGLVEFVREAGAEYSTPSALNRDLTSYVRDQGVEPLVRAIAGRDPNAAVKMLKTVSGRAQQESDDPGSILD
jgi:hypothetical protein